jgi:NAD-dependent SIR2 family protein deacetylase
MLDKRGKNFFFLDFGCKNEETLEEVKDLCFYKQNISKSWNSYIKNIKSIQQMRCSPSPTSSLPKVRQPGLGVFLHVGLRLSHF